MVMMTLIEYEVFLRCSPLSRTKKFFFLFLWEAVTLSLLSHQTRILPFNFLQSSPYCISIERAKIFLLHPLLERNQIHLDHSFLSLCHSFSFLYFWPYFIDVFFARYHCFFVHLLYSRPLYFFTFGDASTLDEIVSALFFGSNYSLICNWG